MKKKAILIGNADNRIDYVYTQEMMERLQEQVELYPERITPDNLGAHAEALRETELAFSTWGMCRLEEEQIRQYFPKLKLVLYAAGSVKSFAEPLLASGVRVTSAQSANAVPVAEYTAAQIVLANKGYYQAASKYKASVADAKAYYRTFPGNYRTKVGIIGAGRIGRGVIQRLSGYEIDFLVFDPYLPEEGAEALGVQKASLETLFAACQTISNHLANNPETVGMLNGSLFDRMLPNATFINTGRGAQVVEADLVRALQAEPARTAILDVTYPEPAKEGHPFLTMDNVIITPHISGSFNQEVARMAEFMLEEAASYASGEELRYEIHQQDLATLG
ncbi:hydroxyacid dehydrogenase [Paenibacillus sp. IB182496]|uniref:Hydroxyacid dehydrogenase n=1 Tax=Paenibacillus sabuli TaxID=2772509 RepID=A0A927BP91_9BACL|nr:hydroxyacid dehydrogenase [Paenibacillus sabuli]MBD2843742.1 hydroxyacid dehydrogenase [Paenibacillus sabuli]